MTDAEPRLNVLALNSGSSSLKFGLYRAESSRIERLLAGEAESIGDRSGRFHAKDSRQKTPAETHCSSTSKREPRSVAACRGLASVWTKFGIARGEIP
jgi:acetate kinase